MKKLIFTILSVVVVGSFAPSANAQMMGNFSNSQVYWNEVVEHTAREEQEGKELWNKLQTKEVACENLNDEQYGVLGEYFMGTVSGDSHAAMNAMMIQTHGEEGEEQIHIVIGKRMSGCEPGSQMPAGMTDMMSMMMGMGMLGTGFNSFNDNSMMGSYGIGGLGGGVFMIIFWILIIIGVVALVKYVVGNAAKSETSKNALDILKERYAKGEMNRDEFEEKKKDLQG